MADNAIVHPPENKWSLRRMPVIVLFKDARLVFKTDSLGMEILRIALPAALALAADPIASLIDTVFIGHLGPVELAAVGVSIAIFNQASRITIFPLVSITTSFVAEEDTLGKISPEARKDEDLEKSEQKNNEMKESAQEDVVAENLENDAARNTDTKEAEDGSSTNTCKSPSAIASKTENPEVKKGKRHIPSASTALILGSILGLLQVIFLVFGAKILLSFMGVKHDSPMLNPALKYLILRSLGAPAVLLSLAMQGVFRGFKDTKTPLYATVAGDLTNIILDPIFIFALRLGVSGAAIAHVLSQYLISLILLWRLMKEVNLLSPSVKDLQFGRFLKNGFLLLGRVIAVTFCVTLAASMAARLGSTPMAAFQICLQVWITSSLLADGLAVAGQAIIACAFAEKDYKKVTAAASRVMQMSFVLGVGLAVVVGVGLYFGSGIFSKDASVLHLISIGVPFVAATQPINSLSFVFDGVNYGASDFAYTAYSMVIVAGASIASLFLLSKSNGFLGIWIALTIYMALRTVAGVWRMGTGTGPWRFLRSQSKT
ncbi:protein DETOXIFICATION 43-like [Durio zibethinus]|uniref:Protein DETOXIFICATION n=1 Tax=Durio zibethinus TaxID=66656 RepID=A0A6P6A378_DURZI|nr:protein DETOXIFICATION 43-like [Durio zibethinus]